MASTSDLNNSEVLQSQGRSLVDLPIEILYEIFERLDTLFLHRNVTRVCKHFNSLLSHDNPLWKKKFTQWKRLVHHQPDPYLTHIGMYSQSWKTGGLMSWRDLCIPLCRTRALFMKQEGKASLTIPGAGVDVVHCIKGKNGFCLAGSRDHSIKVWDFNNLSVAYDIGAHNGWVSGLTTWNDHIVSSAWDGSVKIWSLNYTMESINTFLCNLGVMGLKCQGNIIAACTFPHLYLMDPRISRECGLYRFEIPDRSLIQLNIWRDSVILTSRNKKLINFDLRMAKVLECVDIATNSAPRTMAMLDDIIYIGDNGGKVYLWDPSSFKLIDEYVVNDTGCQVRALMPMRGLVMVGTSKGTLEAVSTLKGPSSHMSIGQQCYGGEITAGHYHDGVVAVALQSRDNVNVIVHTL